jgi:hypothetical protein
MSLLPSSISEPANICQLIDVLLNFFHILTDYLFFFAALFLVIGGIFFLLFPENPLWVKRGRLAIISVVAGLMIIYLAEPGLKLFFQVIAPQYKLFPECPIAINYPPLPPQKPLPSPSVWIPPPYIPPSIPPYVSPHIPPSPPGKCPPTGPDQSWVCRQKGGPCDCTPTVFNQLKKGHASPQLLAFLDCYCRQPEVRNCPGAITITAVTDSETASGCSYCLCGEAEKEGPPKCCHLQKRCIKGKAGLCCTHTCGSCHYGCDLGGFACWGHSYAIDIDSDWPHCKDEIPKAAARCIQELSLKYVSFQTCKSFRGIYGPGGPITTYWFDEKGRLHGSPAGSAGDHTDHFHFDFLPCVQTFCNKGL